MVAKNRILSHRFARLSPPGRNCYRCGRTSSQSLPLDRQCLRQRFLSELRIVFGVPLLDVLVAHLLPETARVIAGCGIDASLRRVAKIEFACIENALRTHEAREFRSFRSQVPDEHKPECRDNRTAPRAGRACCGRPSSGKCRPWPSLSAAASFQPSVNCMPLMQMDHQVAAHARAIFLPAAPAREAILVERNLRRVVQPGVPIQVLR